MRIESKLCHLSENRAIVQVNGWLNDKNIGSSLGEGSSVEIAEDRAISRLNKRLAFKNENESNIGLNNDNIIKDKIKVELPKSQDFDSKIITTEPKDWSNELISIDSQIKRLNWSREDEKIFLEDNFGYNHRNKITKYNELLHYLELLKKQENINQETLKTIDIPALIEESNIILNELLWDHKKGSEYLKKEFNVYSRKELDDKQLLSFVNKLRSIRNNRHQSVISQ